MIIIIMSVQQRLRGLKLQSSGFGLVRDLKVWLALPPNRIKMRETFIATIKYFLKQFFFVSKSQKLIATKKIWMLFERENLGENISIK